MKQRIIILVGIVLASFIGYGIYEVAITRSFSPPDVARYNKNGLEINVDYCRPFKKGRLLFGDQNTNALEKFGEPWRTGANEATEISINKDIKFPEGILKAGKYSIYTVPGEEEWTVAFNEKLDYWGRSIFGSPFDPDLDVLRVKVPIQDIPEVVEQFTIDFEDDNGIVKMLFIWDKTKVVLPIEVA
ncbi:DUF2911 domain-containing protein [Fulvivirgaceae bacterium BMA10]|uniref:DUF2911 domain-containing protein n=1 Tax=Splendidivirga corallicola TaxID=3051826 RepID=A0ABT8KNX6_9BACT|nr:DUF2911 domain-containing protein [Fulvivirgaceae bacterium BMA10]